MSLRFNLTVLLELNASLRSSNSLGPKARHGFARPSLTRRSAGKLRAVSQQSVSAITGLFTEAASTIHSAFLDFRDFV